MTKTTRRPTALLTMMLLLQASVICCYSLSLSSYSSFHGSRIISTQERRSQNSIKDQQRLTTSSSSSSSSSSWLTMRKQKASDRRTRRMQRGLAEDTQTLILENLQQTMTKSALLDSAWGQQAGGGQTRKTVRNQFPNKEQQQKTGGRGRSRKRATLYNTLSSYHNKFLGFLTEEYKAEVNSCCC